MDFRLFCLYLSFFFWVLFPLEELVCVQEVEAQGTRSARWGFESRFNFKQQPSPSVSFVVGARTQSLVLQL